MTSLRHIRMTRWILFSSSRTFPGQSCSSIFCAAAGENPLIAYLMAPFLLSLFALSAPLFGGTNFYEGLGQTTGVGLVRSAIFTWLVVRLSGWMRSQGVRIQL